MQKEQKMLNLNVHGKLVPQSNIILGNGTTNPIRTIDGNKYDEQIVANIPESLDPACGDIIIPVKLEQIMK